METGIDSMKYRKSTHLAGVDVEMIIAEKGKCVLTIKQAFYDKGIDVSGTKMDGYVLNFVEDIKPMMVNATNRKTIGNIVKTLKNMSNTESRNIGNWEGLQIELVFDPNVKMMGQIVGGIKVSPISPIPDISDTKALKIINSSKSLEELKTNWTTLTKQEQQLPTVIAAKDALKPKLK